MPEAFSMASGFGRRLRELRTAAGKSQEELAHAAGVTLGTVSKIENGKVEPTWITARALAKALGVSVAVFEVDEPDQPAEPEPPATPKPKGKPPKK